MSIFALALSQPLVVCETQNELVFTVAVLGFGAVAMPVPPVAVVYHFKFEPAAVKGLDIAF